MTDSTNPTPLEALFDIEPGSTQPSVVVPTNVSTELIDPTTGEIVERTVDADRAALEKEERIEDLRIDAQLSEVHSAAMGAFYNQSALSQQVDPKFSARNSEVAAQFLNIALETIKSRTETKYKREKIRIAKKMDGGAPSSNVQNNIIVANRNDVLKSLFRQDYEKGFHEQLKDELNPHKD